MALTVVAFPDCARLVGYARVSTQDQDLALQIDALTRCGVAKELIFTDKASGAKHQRPGLDTCLDQLQAGDILLVWRLDRLGRSMRHLVTLIDQLREFRLDLVNLLSKNIPARIRDSMASVIQFVLQL